MTCFRHYDILAKTRRRMQTATTFSLTLVHPRALLRDGPLESYGGRGGGEFSSRRNFFSLLNFLYQFFLGRSMNIF